MSFILGAGKPPKQEKAPEPPTADDTAAAKRAASFLLTRSRGRRATNLTGGQGVQNAGAATGRATLLSGSA